MDDEHLGPSEDAQPHKRHRGYVTRYSTRWCPMLVAAGLQFTRTLHDTLVFAPFPAAAVPAGGADRVRGNYWLTSGTLAPDWAIALLRMYGLGKGAMEQDELIALLRRLAADKAERRMHVVAASTFQKDSLAMGLARIALKEWEKVP